MGRELHKRRARPLAGGLLAAALWAAAASPVASQETPAGAAVAARPAPEDAARAALAARLDATLATPALRGATLGARVVRARDGYELYARNDRRPMVPASNQKILTALAALSAWGPSHRFVTEVRVAARPDAEGAVDALYVRGGGDPAATSEQWWRLAADLRNLGVERVRGDLVLDDGAFDHERWHPSWGAVSSRAYHAPVGALSANYGAFTVHVDAGAQPGEPVDVHVDPPVGYLEVVNRARTGPRGGRSTLRVDREPAGPRERVVIAGSVPAGSPTQVVPRSVADPTRYAGAVLGMQLEAVGIDVRGGVREGSAPDDAVLLLRFEGLPLRDVVARFMKWSNNQIGEALLKGLALRDAAPQGTFTEGAAAVRRELERLGLDTEGLVLLDGSGLSYHNQVSAHLLVDAVLVARRRFGLWPEFLASLPIAGVDGTLRDRAGDSRARAKTGLLTRVSTLSGVVQARDGEMLAFSVLVNGFRGSARGAMRSLDGFVEELGRLE